MEKAIVGLSTQDFFELYRILVKSGLLESKSLLSGIEALESSVITSDWMSFLDENTEIPVADDADRVFAEPCEHHSSEPIINQSPQSIVEFIDLQEIYEKVQSRAGGGSHQRVSSGLINIKATSEGQLCGMNVFVQRLPEAAVLCGDTNGRVPLAVTHEDYLQNQQLFSIDLDSVYDTPNGIPVYKLATVDAERRNLFNLTVFLKFIDGSHSGPFMSKPFLIRSRKPGSRSNSFEYNSD